MNKINTDAELDAWRAQLVAAHDPKQTRLRVCDGTGCRALGSQKVLASLREELKRVNLSTPIQVVGTGCPVFASVGR